MAKKNKLPTLRIPRGLAVYPRLDTPDTKFHGPGVYKADVRLTAEAAEPIIAEIQKLAVELMGEELPVSDSIIKKKGKFRPNEDNSVFQPHFDSETGEMTGDWVIMCRVKNQEVKDKRTGEDRLWDRKPKLFTASGKPANKAKVGGGSIMSVVVEVYVGKIHTGEPFMSLQPQAIQIYKLVEWTSGDADASDFGFEAEDGWEGDDDDFDMGDDDDNSSDEDDDLNEGEDDF